ncbi:MAG: argininosuccinate lyase [Acidobacteria bacterium]|nr:argininosuccinate lyase [Acidobacteriota bacterium]
MIKTQIQKLIAIVAVSFLVASMASAQGKQDFTLHNNTGVEIHKLFISPHDVNEWEEDILGKDTLADGETLEINFSRKETAKLWDLKIVDKEGTSIEWENLNLLEISEVTLHFKDGKATAEVK